MSGAHSYSHSRAHSPTFSSLHLRHSSFSNLLVTSPKSQLILQRFRCFTYETGHGPTLLLLLLRHWLFTYVTWQAAHGYHIFIPSVSSSSSCLPGRDCGARKAAAVPKRFRPKPRIPSLVGHLSRVSYVYLVGQSLQGR